MRVYAAGIPLLFLALCSGPGMQPSQPTQSPATAPATASSTSVSTTSTTPAPNASPESGRGTVGYGINTTVTDLVADLPVSATIQVPQPPAGDPNLNEVAVTMKAAGEGGNCGPALCGATLEAGPNYWIGAGWSDTARFFRVEDHSFANPGFPISIPIDTAFLKAYVNAAGCLRERIVYTAGTGTTVELLNQGSGNFETVYSTPDEPTQQYGGWVMFEIPTWSNTPCVGLPTITVTGLDVPTSALEQIYAGPCAEPGDGTVIFTADGFTWKPLQ